MSNAKSEVIKGSMYCTVVMYHYVRELALTRYPSIKGLNLSAFREQVKYLKKHYVPTTVEELIAASEGKTELPKNSFLLTFDDGYTDHFYNVFPILGEEKIQGLFFPPAKSIMDRKLLDVNKIHFLLASTPDIKKLSASLLVKLKAYREEYSLEPDRKYLVRVSKPNRYDSAEVNFVKRMLQRELPLEVRTPILDELFQETVSIDEAAFAEELYMSIDQLKCLVRSGMEIGSHSYDHFWMDGLDEERQGAEIERSLEFLSQLGVQMDAWTFAYPYGGYNESLLRQLKKRKCRLAFTTVPEVAEVSGQNALTLQRLNTNDLPKIASAEPNEWTLKVL